MMLLFAYYYAPSLTIREQRLKNYMSEEHYLQVRDDYPIFDPNLFESLPDNIDNNNVRVKRKHVHSEEGKGNFNVIVVYRECKLKVL